MESKIEKTVVLKLSEKEACWLMNVMQNPFEHTYNAFKKEDNEQRIMRYNTFEKLKSALVTL